MGSPPPIQLATLGMWDTLLLMALALVVFGPRRLPKIGRQLGKLMYEFRKASNDFKFQMEEELRNAEEADRRKKEEEQRQRALTAAPQTAQLEAKAPQVVTAAPTQESAAFVLAAADPPAETKSPDTKPEAAVQQELSPPAAEPTENVPAAAVLHIKPPSTGETVSADPPAQTQGTLFPEAERSEPAAHHG